MRDEPLGYCDCVCVVWHIFGALNTIYTYIFHIAHRIGPKLECILVYQTNVFKQNVVGKFIPFGHTHNRFEFMR